jgi:hypothetical protein
MHDFQSTLTTVQFSSLVMFGHTIQHSVVSAEGPLNASMIHQLLKCDEEMHCHHFCLMADGW